MRRGGFLYNLWKDARNPRGALAAHDARKTSATRSRAGRRLLDIDRLAHRRERRLAAATGCQPLPGSSRVHPQPFRAAAVMRRCCANSILDTKAFVADGFYPARSEERRRLDLCRHAAAFERPRRGHGDHFRLREDRPAVAARRARRTGPGAVRGDGRSSMAAYCSVDDTVPTPTMWFIDKIDFFDLHLWLGDRDRSAHQARPADRHLALSASATGWP